MPTPTGYNDPVMNVYPDGMTAQRSQTAGIYYDWDEGGYRTQGGEAATAQEALSQVNTQRCCGGNTIGDVPDKTTPWQVGWEWLSGTGPRDRSFKDGDVFTELLKRHEQIEATRAKIKAAIVSDNDGTFSGIRLPLKYLLSISQTGIFDGSGKWELKQDQGRWVVGLDFDVSFDVETENGFETIILLSGSGIMENKAPWYMFLWIEEEGGERYKFSKF